MAKRKRIRPRKTKSLTVSKRGIIGEGQEPKWIDPVKFGEAVDIYFTNKKIIHTWSGLALHLGFTTRQSLQDYKHRDGFGEPIKKALLQIEQRYEEGLHGNKPVGSIFALKNFGWVDKQEVQYQGISATMVSVKIIKPKEDED